jgi:hypothetical protein
MDRMGVRDRVGDYRRRMREQGYRPVQVWVPDVRTEQFAAEAHRQSAAVAAVGRDSDDQDFIEAVSIAWDE